MNIRGSSNPFRATAGLAIVLVYCLSPLQLQSTLVAEQSGTARSVLSAKGCRTKTDDKGTVISVSATGGAKTLTDADMMLIGEFHSLKYLNLHQHDITDKGFESLSGIIDLEELYANATLISDASAKRIATWKNLRTLFLPDGITDIGMPQLGGLDRLEWLVAGGAGITDKSIDTLLKFPRLRQIGLGPNVTVAGYERLTELPNVENIQTFDWMGDSIMAVLAKFPNLNHLNLHNTKITQGGLPHLRQLKNLNFLSLPKGTTDEGLQHIAHMRKLSQLDLRHTQITDDGLVALKDMQSFAILTLPPTTGDTAVDKIIEYKLRINSLNLMGPGYTDACIPALISLQGTLNLGLWRTKISEEGFKQLQQARPGLKINRS